MQCRLYIIAVRSCGAPVSAARLEKHSSRFDGSVRTPLDNLKERHWCISQPNYVRYDHGCMRLRDPRLFSVAGVKSQVASDL